MNPRLKQKMFHQIKFCSIKRRKDPVMIELHIDRTNIFKKGAEQKFNFEKLFPCHNSH